MGAGHGILIKALTGGGLPAGLVAIRRGDAGEAVARRRHGRIGITPGIPAGFVRGVADVVEVMALVVVPGPGRSLGGSPTDQQSCGKKRERRIQAGYASRCQLLGSFHQVVPFRLVMPRARQVEPPSRLEEGAVLRRNMA
jgi:hypothetical protein